MVERESHLFLNYENCLQKVNFEQPNLIKSLRTEDTKTTAMNLYQNFVLLGTEKGVLKVYDDQFKLVDLKKLFYQEVRSIFVEEDKIVCLCKSEIFVLKIEAGKIRGIFLYLSGTAEFTVVNQHKGAIQAGFSNGFVRSIELKEFPVEKTEKNFVIPPDELSEQTGLIRMALEQKPQIDQNDIMFVLNENMEKVDVEWDPMPIRAIIHLPSNEEEGSQVLVSSEGPFVGHAYVLSLFKDFSEEKGIKRPLRIIKSRDKIIVKIQRDASETRFLWGYIDGVIEIRQSDIQTIEYRVNGHDLQLGRVTYFKFDVNSSSFLSASLDGTLNLYKVDPFVEELCGKTFITRQDFSLLPKPKD